VVRRREVPLLVVAAALGAGCYLVVYRGAALAGLGPLRNLAATLAASVPYAVAVWAAGRLGSLSTRGTLGLLVGGAVALRLCLPADLLEGSDDAYRYLWDGRVIDAGVNPYRHAPSAPALASLRDEVFHPRVFRPEMRTVYPPLAELWFWVAYRLAPGGFGGLKLVLLLHDVASALLLWWLLRRRGQPPLRALVYAWSPLAVVQLFAGAHVDGLALPWCLLALVLARRPAAAGAALGAAAMVRPSFALCVPALALRRPWREALAAGGGAVGAAALLLAPFVRAGSLMWESLLVYARHWRFNGSLFRIVEAALGPGGGARTAALAGSGLLSIAAGLLPLALSGRFVLALAGYLALAPTVYPWYLLPLVALGALYPGPLVVALPALVGLSDLVFLPWLEARRWQVPRSALALEYGLVYGLLLWEGIRRWRRRPKGPAPTTASAR